MLLHIESPGACGLSFVSERCRKEARCRPQLRLQAVRCFVSGTQGMGKDDNEASALSAGALPSLRSDGSTQIFPQTARPCLLLAPLGQSISPMVRIDDRTMIACRAFTIDQKITTPMR